MNPERTSGVHLNMDVLIRAADGELPEPEILSTRKHLAVCDECNRVFEEIQELSAQVEAVVALEPVPASFGDRQQLARTLNGSELAPASSSQDADRNARFIMRRFGWSMAVAASVALGVMIASHARETPPMVERSMAAQTGALEVDGESFIPLPYSNPDLPVNSSRVVQMQVPVSSLTDAGVVFEPVANSYRSADRTVLADVLIGTDGQPLGVHILGVE